jgi:hypothetical protein
MHACELVELAAVVCAHGPVLVRGGRTLSTTAVEPYWTASKCRQQRWSESLKQWTTDAVDAGPAWHDARWPTMRAVLEEILTGEVLTRVFAAVMCAYDRRHGTDVVDPIVRSILVGHLEARHRVLGLLVRGPGVAAEEAVKLNRLRRRTERWSDMLIGYLTGLDDVAEFAVERRRAEDFAEDLHYQSAMPGGRHAWPLVQASLRASFRRGLCPLSPNGALNARIAAAVLSCFGAELFDSTGVFRSLWMLRLTNATADAEGMLEELLARDGPSPKDREKIAAQRHLDRLRRFGGG